MILQEKLVKKLKKEVSIGKSLTYPDLGVDVKQALQQYVRGSLENRAVGYYMDQGMEVPDLHMMTKIEKLEMLSQWRKEVNKNQDLLTDLNEKAIKRAEEKEIEKMVNQKADEKIKQQSEKQRSGDNSGKD